MAGIARAQLRVLGEALWPIAVAAILVACIAGRGWLTDAGLVLLAGAAAMPLILLVMDAGQPLDLGVLGDRLLATLLGAALAVATNLAFGVMSGPA